MKAGVSKSGSPAPKPTTSIPAFFMALALALTASVMESATTLTRSASEIIDGSLGGRRYKRWRGISSSGRGIHRRDAEVAELMRERGLFIWFSDPLRGLRLCGSFSRCRGGGGFGSGPGDALDEDQLFELGIDAV